MDEKKEREYVEGKELTVESINLETMQKNPEVVSKIVFNTEEKGRITYKITENVEEKYLGMIVAKKIPCRIDNLPKKILNIARIVQQQGFCKVSATFNVWNTEVDDEPITYRFVQGERMFNKWEILKELSKVKTEEVKD